jgi:hypothetical protein
MTAIFPCCYRNCRSWNPDNVTVGVEILTMFNTYRITAILKVEIDIITNISASPIERVGIFVIMSVKAFRTDIIVFIGDIIMCFTSDWPIKLCMQVTNWRNILMDQDQFSDPDFISGKHQRENVQFADYMLLVSCTVEYIIKRQIYHNSSVKNIFIIIHVLQRHILWSYLCSMVSYERCLFVLMTI